MAIIAQGHAVIMGQAIKVGVKLVRQCNNLSVNVITRVTVY